MNNLPIIKNFKNKLLKYGIGINNIDEICIVGGCVRDFLLGTKFKDIDITGNIDPLIIKNIFKNYNLEFFLVPGLNQENFGIVKFKYKGYNFEYMHYRKDLYTKYNDFIGIKKTYSINDDFTRRDFTVNAIYYNIFTNKYIDPSNGIQDIKKGIINVIGNIDIKLKEDPLRIIRLYKLIIKYNFKMSYYIIKGLKDNLSLLSKIHYIKGLNFIFELIKNNLFYNFYNLYIYNNFNKELSFSCMNFSIDLYKLFNLTLGFKGEELNNINSVILLYEGVNKNIDILTYFDIENKYTTKQIKSIFLYYEKFIKNYYKYNIDIQNKNIIYNLGNFIFNNEFILFKSKNDYILFFTLLYKLGKISGLDLILLNKYFKKNKVIFKSQININNETISYIKSLGYKNINQGIFDLYIKNNINI